VPGAHGTQAPAAAVEPFAPNVPAWHALPEHDTAPSTEDHVPALQSEQEAETFDVLPVTPKDPGKHCEPRHAPSPADGAHMPDGHSVHVVADCAPSMPTDPAGQGRPTQLAAPAESVYCPEEQGRQLAGLEEPSAP